MPKEFTTECDKALAALRVYVERGHMALESLIAGQFDRALDLLFRRNAAFHNFKVYAAGLDIDAVTHHPEYKPLAERMSLVETQLSQNLAEAKWQLQHEIQSCVKNKATIHKFRNRYTPRYGMSIGV